MGARGATVILLQQSVGLEGEGGAEGGGGGGGGRGVQCDSFCERLRRNNAMFGW